MCVYVCVYMCVCVRACVGEYIYDCVGGKTTDRMDEKLLR